MPLRSSTPLLRAFDTTALRFPIAGSKVRNIYRDCHVNLEDLYSLPQGQIGWSAALSNGVRIVSMESKHSSQFKRPFRNEVQSHVTVVSDFLKAWHLHPGSRMKNFDVFPVRVILVWNMFHNTPGEPERPCITAFLMDELQFTVGQVGQHG